MLSVGLVAFTVAGVAALGPWLFAGFTWQLGFVLGAVVCTTDSVAATSIAKRLGLPAGIVSILEGESLVNDATGLLVLEFGLAMVARSDTPTLGEGFLRLAYLIFAGIGIGLLLGKTVEWFENQIDDGPIEIVVSILVPYAAYLAAEYLRASGVLAVVACGLYLSRRSARFFSPQVRLQAWAVWNSLTFALNGLVFVLIGLQLPYVLSGIRDHSKLQLILYGGLMSLLVIVLRLVWTFPSARFSFFVRVHLLHRTEPRPPARQIFVVGWTGLRGVIALAAALSLPETLADGSPFPQRNLIIFLTFSVILTTLVLQGLTLPWLIRMLGLAGVAGPNCEETEARRIVTQAALDRLEQERAKDTPEFAAVYEDIGQHYQHRPASLGGDAANDGKAAERSRAQLLELELLGAGREAALSLRGNNRISDDVLRLLERELDLRESNLSEAAGEG